MKEATALTIVLLCWAVGMTTTEAQEVKYCKNFTTGDIVVVEAGMPCPFPTVEI